MNNSTEPSTINLKLTLKTCVIPLTLSNTLKYGKLDDKNTAFALKIKDGLLKINKDFGLNLKLRSKIDKSLLIEILNLIKSSMSNLHSPYMPSISHNIPREFKFILNIIREMKIEGFKSVLKEQRKQNAMYRLSVDKTLINDKHFMEDLQDMDLPEFDVYSEEHLKSWKHFNRKQQQLINNKDKKQKFLHQIKKLFL